MTLDNLRLIRDVAYQHSISRAARLNTISQSAASQAIQEVERELDTQLFDRSTRPITVTPAGRVYVEYCRDVLRRYDELQASLNKLKQQIIGRARLAAIYSVGLSEMGEIESRFAERFPGAVLEVSYLRPERVWQAVDQDMADLGLMSYAESSREIVALPWRDEEMVVAVAPDHPLAGRNLVMPGALGGSDFVGFDEDLPIQDQIDRYFREHKVTVETVLRFDNIEMIKQAVSHGAGISIMPERVIRTDIESGRLAAVRLLPADLHRPVRIIHRRRRAFNDVTRGLLDLIQEGDPVTREAVEASVAS